MSEPLQSEVVPPGQLPQTRREIRIVEDSGPVSNLMDTARFEHLQRIAQVMARMSLLPDHLRGYYEGFGREKTFFPFPNEVQAANCFRVTNQALRWQMDPFAIVDETYVVGGKLGYSGKLVAAVVNSRAGLKTRLRYDFTGAGPTRSVKVIGTFEGEDHPREVELRLSDAKTDNQMWSKDPDQKLIYSSVVKWARRHCPEVVLGVLTDDDLERMSAQPPAPGNNLNDRLKEFTASRAETLPPAQSLPALAEEDAAPAVEPESTPEPEVHQDRPERQQHAPTEPIATYEDFVAGMESVAMNLDKSDGDLQTLLSKLVINTRVKSETQTARVIRAAIVDAAKAGKLDWSTGKIGD